MNLIVIVIVVLLLLGVLGSPALGVWNHGYGWGPSGGIVGVILLLIVLRLLGVI